MEFQEELAAAVRLAREADEIVRKHMSMPPQISYKGAHDPVTETDKELNAFLLGALQRFFPRDAFLCEESSDSPDRLKSHRLWCIDPLDGTKEFISGTGEFSIMIGLAVKGEAVMGVVQQPVPGLTYWGTRSEAWLSAGNTAPIRLTVSSQQCISDAVLVTSRSHHAPSTDEFIKKAGIQHVVKSGSVGVKCGLIVSQRADLYVYPAAGIKEWDACAPEAILRGAGGEMTDMLGQRLRYNQPNVGHRNGIVASNGALHPSCLKLLAEIGKD